MPSQRPQKGRQAVRGITGEDSWAGADEDFDRALAFTPAAFTWVRDKAHLVEMPALWARVPLAGRDPEELGAAVDQVLADEGCPLPHFVVAGGAHLVVLWRIKPLWRPAPGKPRLHHEAFAGALERWRRTSIKLSLVLEPLGARPLDVALVDDHLTSFVPLPLEPTSPLHGVLGLHDEAPVLVRATVDDTPVLIADLSKPLKRFDAPMFKIIGLEAPRRGRMRWLSTPTSLAAAEPKKPGERHPAAVQIICAARWDGESEEQIEGRLRAWAASCTQDGRFPKRRGNGGDELTDIIGWSMRKLVVGGPNLVRADKKKRPKKNTTVQEVADATRSFLRDNGGVYEGSKEGLAKQVALWRTEHGQPGRCPLRTFRRVLGPLKAAGELTHEVVRDGRTWRSTWRLRPGESPMSPDSAPSRGQPGVSSWAPPTVPSSREGAAGERPLPAGGVQGGAGDRVEGTERQLDLRRQDAARLASSPENDQVPRQRRLRLGRKTKEGLPRRRRAGTEGKGLPPITGELLSQLADVAPKLSTDERRELLELARSKLRPRPSVLADFARHLRKRALRIRRKQVLASLRPAPEPAAPDLTPAPSSTTTPEVQEFRRLLTLVHTPLHLRPIEDRARRLHDEGLSILPLEPRSKAPALSAWTEHQTTPMRLPLLRRHLAELGTDAGLAVVCGRVSGVVVCDFDDSAGVAWAHKHLPTTPWRTKTSRGEHWYFRLPSTWTPPTTPLPWKGELRGDGLYVVAPGSIHPDTGDVYEALGDWREPKAALPVFDVRWLVDVDRLRAARAGILKE